MFKRLFNWVKDKQPTEPATVEQVAQWIDEGIEEYQKTAESLKRKEQEFDDKRKQGARLTKHRIPL